MGVTTFLTSGGEVRRLGRIRPKSRPLALRLAVYHDRSATPPPAVVDYSPKAMAAVRRMYMNDTYGDCVIAGKMHQLGIWSGNDADAGGLVMATDREVEQQYFGICGPGDNGCVITDVLDYFQKKGLQAGGKKYLIDGYVAVDWTNELEAKVALYLFGSLSLGINLPGEWLDTPDDGMWSPTSSRIVGGHDVCAIGYNQTGVVICTWGGLRTITWPAFTSTRWLEECYAQLAPLWYNNDNLAPCGINAETLAADLVKIGNGTIPPIDPTPPPPIPPVPNGGTGKIVLDLDVHAASLPAGWKVVA